MDANSYGVNFSIWTQITEGLSWRVQKSLDDGADINKMVWYNNDEPSGMTHMTGLHIAAVCGQTRIVTLLVENGANISIRDSLGRTALHCAVKQSEEECAEILLQKGSDINTECNLGETPLHTAVKLGDLDMVRMLLRYKASVLKPSSIGRVAMWYAFAHWEMTQFIEQEELTTAICLAFAMSHHPRLGDKSMPAVLDEEVLRMVIKLV